MGTNSVQKMKKNDKKIVVRNIDIVALRRSIINTNFQDKSIVSFKIGEKHMELDINVKGIDKIILMTNPKLYSQTLNRSINEMGRKITTGMTREVRKKYNIKAADLKKYMKVKRSNYSNLEYSINISSKTRNVMHFGARALKAKGKISIRIKKDKGRTTLVPAFRAKNSGAVLTRIKGTQEIKSVHTLSIPQMFNNKVLEKAEEQNSREFSSVFKKNFEYYSSKI